MLSNDFLKADTRQLELEIQRHCIGLGMDCSDTGRVKLLARELLQDMDKLKEAASKGDRTARAKVELYSMMLMMHDANTKAFGADYLTNLKALGKQQGWLALTLAMRGELESRNPSDQ